MPEKVAFDAGKCWTVTIGGGGVGVWDEVELFNESLLFTATCSSLTGGIGGELIWYIAFGWFRLLKRLKCGFNGRAIALESWVFEFIGVCWEVLLFGRCKLPKLLDCWREWPGPIPIMEDDPLIFKDAWGLATVSRADAVNIYRLYQFAGQSHYKTPYKFRLHIPRYDCI